jgi:hypothetical protein
MKYLMGLYPGNISAGAVYHLTPSSDVKDAAVPPIPLTPSWPDLYLYVDMSSAEVGKLMVRKFLVAQRN